MSTECTFTDCPAREATREIACLKVINQDLIARLQRLRDEGLATADLIPIHDCTKRKVFPKDAPKTNGRFIFFLAVDKAWAEHFNDSACNYHGEEWGQHECDREIKVGEILQVSMDWDESRAYWIQLHGKEEEFDRDYELVGKLYSTRAAAQDSLCQARMIDIPAEIRKIADEVVG